MLADVKTAFLHGDARRSLYVKLLPEDPLAASGRYVGKLERAMYGTRDDPMTWQDHLPDDTARHEVQGVCDSSRGVST